MSQAKLTHKVRNPKAGQENSWINIWTATVDNNNNYTITPSDNWRFSVNKLTDLVVPFYNLNSESEKIGSDTETNNLKSISIKLQEDDNSDRNYEISAGEIKISAGDNVTLTAGDANNEYSINSTWQQNTATQNGYVSEIRNSDTTTSKLVWGWRPKDIAPAWWPIEELDNSSAEGWEVSIGYIIIGKEDPQKTLIPGTTDKYLQPNTLWIPNQVTTSVNVSQNSAGEYIVNTDTMEITGANQVLALPNLMVQAVTGLNNLNNI